MSDVWCPGQSWSQGGPGEARCRGTAAPEESLSGHRTAAPLGASRLVSTKRQELQSIRLQAKAAVHSCAKYVLHGFEA